MCVVTGHIECVYLQNIKFSILQQFKQESPVFLKIVGLHTLGTGCDATGVITQYVVLPCIHGECLTAKRSAPITGKGGFIITAHGKYLYL